MPETRSPATGRETPESLYLAAELQRHEIEDATIGLRVFGQGPAVVLIHGYPVHGYTWRKLLPTLAESFTCYVIDLPGLGDSDWTSGTDFTFTAQARRLGLLIEALRLDAYTLVAHDTGATLARLVALSQPQRVTRLAMINTEMPGHRPPWIPFYQFTAGLPLAPSVFRTLLSWRWFRSSSMGMGQFYTDKTLFDAPGYIAPYVDPLIRSKRRMRGMLAYLRCARHGHWIGGVSPLGTRSQEPKRTARC